MDVSIIIVNWNSADYVRKCVASVLAHTQGLTYQIIVVDGASFDGCGAMLAREHPEVHFIQSQENVGFGRANNLGFQSARGRNILCLNPDTELTGNTIRVLMERLESLPGAGAVGCRVLNADGTLQTSCIQSFPTVLNQLLDSDFLRARFPRSRLWGTAAFLSSGNHPEVVEAVTGACVMLKREVVERVGGFSPEFFMYGEDLDLCFKVRKSGQLVYYVPETSLIHYGGSSTRKQQSSFSIVLMRHSVQQFLRMNRGVISASLYRLMLGGSSIVRLLLILPLLLAGDRVVRHGRGSMQKWMAILRWSLGLESWTRKYSR